MEVEALSALDLLTCAQSSIELAFDKDKYQACITAGLLDLENSII